MGGSGRDRRVSFVIPVLEFLHAICLDAGQPGKGKKALCLACMLLGELSNRGLWVPSTESICDRYCICMYGWERYVAVPR